MPDPLSLEDVRARIDDIDADLVRLLADRQSLVRAAAEFKTDEQAVRAPARVAQVIAKARERAATAGLDPAVAESVWQAMIDAFIELEMAEHAAHRPRPATGPVSRHRG
ncbi:chorismate mutase [Actinomadura sp. HBU206391]|uniref:chorismate mutase n=1 Tax=Actinomadura sp. HBU206391 TaxID=2731692 RepID=UPI00164F1809|nr:chorismate mutase [Actinomadura sp. HBU206391]MBC6463771.1 chorismate mutase [Actinomadura sp. HBU206391]